MTAPHAAPGFAANRATSPTPKPSGSLPVMLAVVLFCSWSCLPMLATNAPVATIGTVANAISGAAVSIPVTFSGFSDIGAFKLTIRYDTNRLTFESVTLNPALTGMTVTHTPADGTKFRTLVFVWSSPTNVSLPDGSSLADRTFTYVTSTGSLLWLTNPALGCRYKRWVDGVLTTLTNAPAYLFHVNGGISFRGAPITFAPVIAEPVVGAFQIAITVSAFTNISTLTLLLEYDPTVITYQGTYTKNAVFNETFLVGNIDSLSGKKAITIGYGDILSLQLADGEAICTLDFKYLTAGAFCSLNWIDNNQSCEYADPSTPIVALLDHPQADYYKNGSVGLPPVSKLQITNAAPGFAAISWTPPDSGFVLQETTSLSPTNWNNAPSGTTNPVTVPTTGPARFYRLIQTGP